MYSGAKPTNSPARERTAIVLSVPRPICRHQGNSHAGCWNGEASGTSAHSASHSPRSRSSAANEVIVSARASASGDGCGVALRAAGKLLVNIEIAGDHAFQWEAF